MLTNRRAALQGGVLAGLFALLTLLVAFQWGALAQFDDWSMQAVHSWMLPRDGAIAVSKAISHYLQPTVFHILLPLVALLLWSRSMRGTAVWVLAGTALEWGLVSVIKRLVERPRADFDQPIATAGGFSFPSGHTSAAALFAGVAVVLAALLTRRRWLRLLCQALGVLVALVMGLSRVTLGVHYPSDVVGSYLLVSSVLLLLAAFINGSVPGRPRRRRAAVAPAPTEPRKSRLALVLNPIKVPDADAFRRTVDRAAAAAGWDEPLWFETTVDDAGHAMAHAALTADADVVVAAGGDGTVRVVASELARTGVPLGIVPTGTGNLLARNLGLPLTLDAALDVILHGEDRAIDLVRMEGDGLEPAHFAVMGGLGLDAAIMQGAPDQLKKRMGWPAYVVSGVRHMRDPAVRVSISVDDRPTIRHRARTVVVGNVGTLTGGIPLLPDATPDDGLLDVVVVAPRRFFNWVQLLVRVLARRRAVDEKLNRLTGRRVVITADTDVPRQMDGDNCGTGTRVEAEVEPGVLLVRVPR